MSEDGTDATETVEVEVVEETASSDQNHGDRTGQEMTRENLTDFPVIPLPMLRLTH